GVALTRGKSVGGDPFGSGGHAHLVARAIVADRDAGGVSAVTVRVYWGRAVAYGGPPVVVVVEHVPAQVAPVFAYKRLVGVAHARVQSANDRTGSCIAH